MEAKQGDDKAVEIDESLEEDDTKQPNQPVSITCGDVRITI